MASYTWINASGGNWSDAANWSPNGVPGAADQALVNLAGTYAISLSVAEIGSLTLNAAGATITPTETLKLDGALDVKAGTLTINNVILGGTLIADGGTINYDGGTLDGVTLQGPLDLSSAFQNVNIRNGIDFVGSAPEQILVTGYSSTLSFNNNAPPADVDLSETLSNVDITLGGNSSLNYVDELTLGATSVLSIVGESSLDGFDPNEPISKSIFDNKGTIISQAGSFLDFYCEFINEGSISFNAGYRNTINSLVNTGTISLSGSQTILYLTRTYNVTPTFSSTGTIAISKGAELVDWASPTTSLGTIAFLDPTGTLMLGSGIPSLVGLNGGYGGTLQGFQAGDMLDLAGTGYSLNHVGNSLTISQNGSVVDSFTLTGQDYSAATFTIAVNPEPVFNETIITTDAPCFCEGTLILTEQGERTVETLAVGDVVVTRQDGVEALLPVRWIGRRRVIVARHHEAEHVDPIRIAQDAIAPGLPARDLFVSPDHALYLDGMLIQARQLVNHMTITRDSGRAVVTYHHVELDRHAILLADGMPCESYLDSGNRGQFDTAGNVVSLHGTTTDRVQHACAPFITSAALVQPIWQRLADRAREDGHVAPVLDLEPDLSPWFETAGGERLMPDGDRLRVALPPGCRRVRLRSRRDLPTTLTPWSDDRRRLGVAISALALHHDGRRPDLALADLDAGWWPLETAGELAWRWTDGDGWIDLPEPASEIEITLHATMPVPVDRPPPARLAPVYAQAG